MLRAAILALVVSLGADAAAAQDLRAFSTFRQLHGETRLVATLDYRAGGLRVSPGRESELYRMDASYDAARFVPVSEFNAASGSVALGLEPAGEGGIRVVSQKQLRQDANLAFTPAVDLDLAVNLGAVDADLELGGLSLSELTLQAGASRAVVRFSEPNRSRCRSAKVTAGAAEVTMLGLGNSRCDRLDFEGGIGKVTLDFDGAWSSSSQATVKMVVGELTLRLPRRVGVRITLDRFLASFSPTGLVRVGDAVQSPGYDRAERKLDISVTSAVGGVAVEWVDDKGVTR